MPDISMCKDRYCPVRATCYRYRAIPSDRQSYAGYKHTSDDGCDRIAITSKGDRLRTMDEIEGERE